MLEIKEVEIKKLVLLDKNPRIITKSQMEKLQQSLIDDPSFLWRRPVLVNDADGALQVYAGNQRVQAAKKLKWKKIPCIIDKELSEEVMHSRIVKDNKAFGSWDDDLLSSLYDVDFLLACGFTERELNIEGFSEAVSDAQEDEPKKKKDKTCPHCGEEI